MADKKTQQSKAIYVICGKDEFLVKSQLGALLDSLIVSAERDMGLWDADAKKTATADVFDELRTLSFTAAKKVVVIKSADNFVSDNRGALERYFDNPSDAGILVMTVSKWPGNTRLAKKLSRFGELIDAGQIKRWDLWSFVVNYARDTQEKKITKSDAELLVELVGDEPGRLCSEVDKLATYVGSVGAAITSKDITALIGANRAFGAFEVIDSMTSSDVSGAVSRLRNMFDSDKSTEFTVVGAFAYHFRRMFSAKALLSKGVPQQQVAKQLNIWGRQDGFFNQLRKMTLEQIADYLKELADIDYRIKTGQATSRTAMESLVVRAACR